MLGIARIGYFAPPNCPRALPWRLPGSVNFQKWRRLGDEPGLAALPAHHLATTTNVIRQRSAEGNHHHALHPWDIRTATNNNIKKYFRQEYTPDNHQFVTGQCVGNMHLFIQRVYHKKMGISAVLGQEINREKFIFLSFHFCLYHHLAIRNTRTLNVISGTDWLLEADH